LHFSLEQVADEQCLFEETIEMGGGITDYWAKNVRFRMSLKIYSNVTY
jgi:hypothetical protein